MSIYDRGGPLTDPESQIRPPRMKKEQGCLVLIVLLLGAGLLILAFTIAKG